MLYIRQKSLFVLRTHKGNVIIMYNFWMLNLAVRKVAGRLEKVKMFHTGFMPVLVLQSLKSQYYKMFKNIKIVLFTTKFAKIILLLQFSCSQSVCWLYIQPVLQIATTVIWELA